MNDSFRFHPADDFLKPEALKTLQERYLREHLAYCRTRSPWYRKKLAGIDPQNFSIDRLGELPITTKDELAADPDAFLAAPWSEVEDVVFSSGTTGEPCRIAYTGNDMKRLAYNEQRCFHAAGLTKEDRVLLTCTLDR